MNTKELIKREKYLNFIVEILKNSNKFKRDNDNKSFVMAIDSSWGSGKTTFINNELMKVKEFKFIYYNAWENDFWDNAYESLISNIIDQLDNNNNLASLKKSALTIGKALLKGVASKYLGAETVENIINVVEECRDNFKEYDFSDYKMFKDSIYKFKRDLSEYVNSHNKPIVIIVDELDRCKPIFAINTMEIVKHLFDCENLSFVFSIDMEQLGNVLKGLYGSEFNGYSYLNRIFDIVSQMPKFSSEEFIEYIFDEKLFGKYAPNIKYFMNKLLRNDNHSVREISSFYNAYRLVYSLKLNKYSTLDAVEFYLLFVCLRVLKIGLYKAFKANDYELFGRFLLDKEIEDKLSVTYLNKNPTISDFGKEVHNERYRSIEVDLEKGIALLNSNIKYNISDWFKYSSINKILYEEDLKNWDEIKNLTIPQFIERNLELLDYIDSIEI